MKLVEASLYAGNTLQSRINHLGSAVKHMQACLSTNKDRERSFHHCGGLVNRASLLMYGKHPTTPF